MRDLALALRMLRRTPFVTIVAVLSLGLGIGANTAIFSLFDVVLMQPLPVVAPEALVNLGAPGPKSGSQSCNNAGDCDLVFSYPMFRDLERGQQVFTGIAAHRIFGANVIVDNTTRTGDGIEVSGSYFSVLGVRPALGRLIGTSDDAVVGESAVVVLSYDYWVSRFDRDPAVLGRTLTINGQPLTVIGVSQEDFDGTTRGTRADVFVPITLRGRMESQFTGFDSRSNYWVYLFARLKPGVSLDEARTGVNVLYQTLLEQADLPSMTISPEQKDEFLAKTMTVEDGRRGQSWVFGQAATPLAILQAVTVIVLFIACANIANLLLARGAARANEMAVRLSIGASRSNLIRQLIIESCVLAGAGGLAGLLVMGWTVSLITSRLSMGALALPDGGVSLNALAFTAGLSLLTGVLFGLFPALQATRPDLATTLKGQSGQPSGTKAAARFRTSLAVAQVALSMGLLACAGLFAKNLINISRVDLGIEVDHLLTFNISPLRSGYTAPRSQQFFQEVTDRLASTAGVVSVSAARVPLIANSNSSTSITVEGYQRAEGERSSCNINEVAPGYFRTIGVPLLAGRDFTTADTVDGPKVAIVNETFARHYNLGPNPVGKRMARTGNPEAPLDIEIVGLVADAKYSEVKAAVPATFFMPYRQNASIGALSFYVRTAGDPAALFATIRSAIGTLDPNLPVQRMYTMEEQVARNVEDDRMVGTLSASFAGLATLLAAVGLYGVLAYTVSQRRREFGVRMALGASPQLVRRQVLRQVMRMAAVGGVIGLGLAMAAGSLASARLYNMSSRDPVVLAVSALVLGAVALAAGFIPALRASRIDPMQALRTE